MQIPLVDLRAQFQSIKPKIMGGRLHWTQVRVPHTTPTGGAGAYPPRWRGFAGMGQRGQLV